MAPLADAIERYQAEQKVRTGETDLPGALNGALRLYRHGQIPGSSEGTIDHILQRLGLTNGVMTLIVNRMLSPTSGSD